MSCDRVSKCAQWAISDRGLTIGVISAGTTSITNRGVLIRDPLSAESHLDFEKRFVASVHLAKNDA